MDKKITIGIIAIVILALLAGYFILMPHYKEIEMSGFTFEVPDTNAEVKNNSNNYNTYIDTENYINIKTWSCKDVNDINGTANASTEMEKQLGENVGTNITVNNLTLQNKSGTYTYYESDVNNSCIILITSKNLNAIEHILETMKKPQLNVDNNPFNMTSEGLVLTESTDNNTSNYQTTTTNKKSSTKKSSSKSSSSSNGGYRWSAQYGDYIKEYTDSNGVQHIDSKKGYTSSYNPRTGVLKENNYEVLLD